MRPDTAPSREAVSGWQAKVDALDPGELESEARGRMAAWRDQAEHLAGQAREHAEVDREALEARLDTVTNVLEDMEALVEAKLPGELDRSEEERLAEQMARVEDELQQVRQALPDPATSA